jgi:hypothetical protein
LLDLNRWVTELNQRMPEIVRSNPRRRAFVEALTSSGYVTPDDLIKAFADPEFLANSVLGSDSMYRRFRRDVLRGRYVALNGSVSGHDTLPSLAKALHDAGKKVSIFDISNVLDHLHVADLGSPPTRGNTLSQFHKSNIGSEIPAFIENLAALPWAKDARVLFTAARPDDKRAHANDGFLYFEMPAYEFVRAGKSGWLDNKQTFNRYIEEIIAGRTDGSLLR